MVGTAVVYGSLCDEVEEVLRCTVEVEVVAGVVVVRQKLSEEFVERLSGMVVGVDRSRRFRTRCSTSQGRRDRALR